MQGVLSAVVSTALGLSGAATSGSFEARFARVVQAHGPALVISAHDAPPSPLSEGPRRAVREVFEREGRRQLRTCAGLAPSGTRLILDMSIRSSGRVFALGIEPASLEKTSLGQCILRTVFRWQFPQIDSDDDEDRAVEVVNEPVPVIFES
ncbi:MAG: hypothetical protein HC923_00965 [Myxococcales bacterium]|nr:hypothetical protein [Myxococcales bacterium]